jgi:hypothetical protein
LGGKGGERVRGALRDCARLPGVLKDELGGWFVGLSLNTADRGSRETDKPRFRLG